jgi:hypothetical protein
MEKGTVGLGVKYPNGSNVLEENMAEIDAANKRSLLGEN